MTEMKPAFRKNQRCPFCGSDELREVRTRVFFYIACPRCFSTGPMCEEVEEAWKAWNRRSDS